MSARKIKIKQENKSNAFKYLKKGLITERLVELISSWRHYGFGAYCGKRINPKEARPPRINTS